MKISVIIPVYNAEKYLKDCLNSFINQTEKDIEIICINDGSNDKSLEILKEYENNYKNIQVYNQENSGVSTARNKGLEIAKGDYIYFFDADDIADRNLLHEVYNIALQQNFPDIIKFKGKAFDDKTGKYDYWSCIEYSDFPKTLYNKILTFEEHSVELLKLGVNPWLQIIKKDFLKENNLRFPNIKVIEDFIFYTEIISKSKSIYVFDKYFVNYRVNNPNSLDNRYVNDFEDFIPAYKYYIKILTSLDSEKYTQLIYDELNLFLVRYSKYINTKYSKKNYNILKPFLKEFDVKTAPFTFKIKVFIFRYFPYFINRIFFTLQPVYDFIIKVFKLK